MNLPVQLSTWVTLVLLQFITMTPDVYGQNPPPSKPNIIFILGDDIGYDIPTVNGGQSYSTPNIDLMARHGMNFTHCEATPLCSPSRFMFLTGKYNFRNYSNWGYMSDSEKTVGNLMHDAGYTTGFFGKLQSQYQNAWMKNWGWDTHTVFDLTEDTMAFRRYKSPALMENGYRIPDSVTANGYCDDILTQKIFDFIQTNQSKPFFVYYAMSLGHSPYSPTPDDSAFATWEANNRKGDTSFFPSMMHYMDKKIGAILNMLHETGLGQNTIVFFAGDNGTPSDIYYNAHGNTNIRGEKAKSIEGGTHVPLIVYWPGHIQPGRINDDLIDLTDFLPTFADIARVQNLNDYGTLDGLSIYGRLLGLNSKKKQQLFVHFDSRPEANQPLQRWVRNKIYKLYDSTDSHRSGGFYNIAEDPEELAALNDSDLTANQISVKENFKLILDTIGTWPACPILNNAFAMNITDSSARIGGTITDSGASALIDRGSNIKSGKKKGPYLEVNRLHANTVSLGTFTQERSGLLPQKQYRYDMYAMNSNKSHSTSYVSGTFYTLSQPPIRQPNSFAASADGSAVTFKWSDAVFPKTGATKAGYLLVYATGVPVLSESVNGKSPEKVLISGNIIPVAAATLPNLPAKQVQLHNLSKGSDYHFLLIPYTWDGSTDSTYNYLVEGARSVTVRSDASTAEITSGISITPNPASTEFHVNVGDDLLDKRIIIKVFDAAGKPLLTLKGSHRSQYVFGKNFVKGTYFTTVTAGVQTFNFTSLKR